MQAGGVCYVGLSRENDPRGEGSSDTSLKLAEGSRYKEEIRGERRWEA